MLSAIHYQDPYRKKMRSLSQRCRKKSQVRFWIFIKTHCMFMSFDTNNSATPEVSLPFCRNHDKFALTLSKPVCEHTLGDIHC